MIKIGFAGSFDPLTKGHLWVIQEALNISSDVYVFVAVNSSKKPMFSVEERIKMIEEATEGKVKVVSVVGEYTAQVAKEQYGCDYLIRGIRNSNDFDYESLIEKTNRDVLGGAKTLFVFPPRDLDSVSSSFVKSLMGPVGWHYYVEDFLPTPVLDMWLNKEINSKKDFLMSAYLKNNALVDYSFNKSLLEAFDTLLAMYEGENRYYHGKSHLLYMLQLLDSVKSNVDEGDLIPLFLAILGHDCIMESKDGVSAERRSADYVSSLIYSLWNTKVHSAIISTSHTEQEPIELMGDLSRILVSLDLAILGASESLYNKYATNVRKEYMQYSDQDYKAGRIKVLETLLEKARNQALIKFKPLAHLNERAVRNIERELLSLK